MHIGLDFDNTIVSYDTLFFKVAVERGWLINNMPISKVGVRNYLRSIGQESIWTEMQGYVYGARMNEAIAFPGVLEFLKWARNERITVSIVSHKTQFPFIGKQYDLHKSAYSWIKNNLIDEFGHLIESNNVYFENTKELKISRIVNINCDLFIDDLPEIFLTLEFPSHIKKILFDPENHYQKLNLYRFSQWGDVRKLLETL